MWQYLEEKHVGERRLHPFEKPLEDTDPEANGAKSSDVGGRCLRVKRWHVHSLYASVSFHEVLHQTTRHVANFVQGYATNTVGLGDEGC